MNHMAGWWCNVPILKNDGVKVNGKDDIPYMKWKIKHVPNHQPAVFNPTGTESLSLALKMWNIGEWMEHLGTTTLFRDGTVMQCGPLWPRGPPQPRNPLPSANLGSAWSCNSSRQSWAPKGWPYAQLKVCIQHYLQISFRTLNIFQHLQTPSKIFQPHATQNNGSTRSRPFTTPPPAAPCGAPGPGPPSYPPSQRARVAAKLQWPTPGGCISLCRYHVAKTI